MNIIKACFCTLAISGSLTLSSPLMAQDKDKDRTEKRDKDRDDDERDGKDEGSFDWGLLGLLGLLGLAGLRKNEDKHVHVTPASSVPRSDSPIR